METLKQPEVTIYEQKSILLSEALSTASLLITKEKDGTLTLVWEEDWDTEAFKDTFTLRPHEKLSHVHYFEDADQAKTPDITIDDTRRTLMRITQYVSGENEDAAFATLATFVNHIG
jgi:hypothetical protein